MKRRITGVTLATLLLVLAAGVGADDAGLAAELKTLQKKLDDLGAQSDAVKAELGRLRVRQQEAKAQQADPTQPQFDLPRLPAVPKIDGVLDDGEWHHAIAVTTGCGIRSPGLNERPSAIFYIGWRPEGIYVAQRLPLRPGEKLKRLLREPRHDNVYAGETAWEFYIDRGSFGSHPSLCRWQFMANASGNRWDMEHQHQIGQKYYDWDGDWQMQQRLTPDGKYWDVEAMIPHTTVYQQEPIADGQQWKIGFATDLHNPWTWSGFYGWNVPARFRDATPSIRMWNPQRALTSRGFGFDMEIVNTTAEPFDAEVVALLTEKQRGKLVELVRQGWPVSVPPGETRKLAIDHPLGEAVKDGVTYDLHYMVMRGGRSVYTWTRALQYNVPDNKVGVDFVPDPHPFVAEARYAPISSYIRAIVDKYDFTQADKVASAEVRLRKAGDTAALASTIIKDFAYGRAERMFDVPRLTPGRYECVFTLQDAAGQALSERVEAIEVRDLAQYPWIGNDLGKEDVVPKLFEPLQVDGPRVRAFKKLIVTGATGLPHEVEVDGARLLSGPVHLREKPGDQSMAGLGVNPVTPTSASETHARYQGRIGTDKLKVDVAVRWEFDSTAKVELTLAPAGAAAELDGLDLVIPFTPEASLNFMTVALNMRQTCRTQRIPAQEGVVWRSTEVPYQKMVAGSFVPVVWVGNRSMGMTWFADSDEGWWPSDARPAIELVRRADGGVDLVCHLAAEPVKLTAPRRIAFGLNVNPVRPMSEHQGSTLTFGFLQEQGRWVPGQSKRKEFALRYPQDPDKARQVAAAAHAYGQIYAPYTEMSAMDMPEDTYQYFVEEFAGPGFGLTPNTNSNDCVIYWSHRFFTECRGDGYYFDNVFPRISTNPRNSTAYELPDGRIQPGYCMWAYRDHFKRLRVLLEKLRPESRICIHNTRFQFAPVMAFADLAMGGEMATPHMGSPDFMDMYPRDMVEVLYNPYLWGYKLSHLYHFKSDSYVDAEGNYDRAAALKVHRSAQGTLLAHGVEFFQSIDYDLDLMRRYQMVKTLCGGQMQFIPWWKSDGLIDLDPNSADQAAAVWRGSKAIIVIVTNYSNRDRYQTVKLDLPRLLPVPAGTDQRVVTDLENMSGGGGKVSFTENVPEKDIPWQNGLDTQSMIPNTLRLHVPARDFRVVLIANLAAAKGAGF